MDEFMKLAGECGIELPDELLDNVAGGRRGFGDIRDFLIRRLWMVPAV